MALTAKSQCEVWGKPVQHSLSPTLHRAAYEALGLPWSYAAREVGEDSLSSAWTEFGVDLQGVSLTMPLKEAVLRLVEHRDPIVDLLQAANTVYRRGDSVVLSNTDAYGVQRALEHFRLSPHTAWIVGAGATARAVGYGLLQRGTSDIVLMVRDAGRAAATAASLSALGLRVEVGLLGDMGSAGPPDIVVSTVPGALKAYRHWPPRSLNRPPSSMSPTLPGLHRLRLNGWHQSVRLSRACGCSLSRHWRRFGCSFTLMPASCSIRKSRWWHRCSTL